MGHSLPMMMGHRGLMWVLGALLALGLASAFSPDTSPPCADTDITAITGGYTCAQIVELFASACTVDLPGSPVSASEFRQACPETCGDCPCGPEFVACPEGQICVMSPSDIGVPYHYCADP